MTTLAPPADSSSQDSGHGEDADEQEDAHLLQESEGSPPPPKTTSKTILYFMTIHFLLAFTEIILVAPLIRLFENSLCLRHYGFPAGGVEEGLCKIPEVQRPLATIRGWKSMFDTLPVLLVAIPIGRMGDQHGRRKIMIAALVGVAGSLSWIGVVCGFPRLFRLELVWLSSFLLLCGGGLNSASAFMWAMASDSIPSERRYVQGSFFPVGQC